MSAKKMKTQCRLCMRVVKDKHLKDISEKVDENYKISDLIFELTTISIFLDENLSSKICTNCEMLLIITADFKSCCIQANQQLMVDQSASLRSGNWMKTKNVLALTRCQEFVKDHKIEIEFMFKPPEEKDEIDPFLALEIKTELIPEKNTVFIPTFDNLVEEEEKPMVSIVQGRRCEVCSYSGPKLEIEMTEEDEELLSHSQTLENSEKICTNCKIIMKAVSAYNYYYSNESYEYYEVKMKCLKALLDKCLSKMTPTSREIFMMNYRCKIEVADEVIRQLFCHIIPEEDRKIDINLVERNDNKVKMEETEKEKDETEEKPKRKRRPNGSSPKEKNHTCHVCGYQTKDATYLMFHLHQHDKIKTLACPGGCGMMFTHRATLHAHYRRKHSDKIFGECDVCGEKFKMRSQLIYHLRFHFPPSFECRVCKKAFHNPKSLSKHMRTHKEEKDKPFRCLVCPKRFFESHKLSVHLRVHTNEKPYLCDKCDFRYSHNCTLKAHQQKCHPEIVYY